MFYSTGDAIRQGLCADYFTRQRWVSLREIFIAQGKLALHKDNFDLAAMFATQAQFCREALEAEEILRQYESDKKTMEIINTC